MDNGFCGREIVIVGLGLLLLWIEFCSNFDFFGGLISFTLCLVVEKVEDIEIRNFESCSVWFSEYQRMGIALYSIFGNQGTEAKLYHALDIRILSTYIDSSEC
jgi:hypothetical protein